MVLVRETSYYYIYGVLRYFPWVFPLIHHKWRIMVVFVAGHRPAGYGSVNPASVVTTVVIIVQHGKRFLFVPARA